VNLSHKSLKELRKINRLTFSIFIQLKMRHDYFKSYLHRLSENNLNKCYEICNARQTSKHLLLNCKHYKAEQRKLKKKAQLKNTNIIVIDYNWLIMIVIHTLLWHRFKLDSWETLCYLYWVNKTLWERKSLVVYMTASRSWNNEIDTVLSSNESIASIQRVMLE
jgi:hypothetical protein